MLGVTENQGALWIVVIEQSAYDLFLILSLYLIVVLLDKRNGQFLALDLDHLCILLVTSGNAKNLIWHCCRKQCGLMFLWYACKDGLNILYKSHV